jgi:hypothetical protein
VYKHVASSESRDIIPKKSRLRIYSVLAVYSGRVLSTAITTHERFSQPL